VLCHQVTSPASYSYFSLEESLKFTAPALKINYLALNLKVRGFPTYGQNKDFLSQNLRSDVKMKYLTGIK
jgi:hypothetical protein